MEPSDIEGLMCWHEATDSGYDIFRRLYLFNKVRPITRWRRFRAWIGWHEKDTMVSKGARIRVIPKKEDE